MKQMTYPHEHVTRHASAFSTGPLRRPVVRHATGLLPPSPVSERCTTTLAQASTMMSKPLKEATDFPNVMLNVTSLNNQQSSDIAGGVAFSMLVVCALALTLVDPLVPDVMDTIEDLGYSNVDAAVPLTATDVVSVTVGEAVGGIVGAVTSYSIAQLIRASQVIDKAPKVSDAVANGDFLVTQAAAYPLLNAIGVPPFLATVGSALLASVPAEIVKNTARRQRQQQEEELVLEQLLTN